MSRRPRLGGRGRSADRGIEAVTARFWINALGCVVATLLPVLAYAQEVTAPIPMPRRADRMPAITETATQPAPAQQEVAIAPPAESPTPAPATAKEAVAAVAVNAEKQKVTLTAQITENGMNIPEGLVWRVFDTKADANGELALAAKSEDSTARFELVPGQYVVHVAYGRAQASETLDVGDGGTNKSIVLDAGAMRLNAAITGDVAIPINLLRFDVYTAGNEADRTLVAQNLAANDIVTLNAGTYHVISYFGEINAVVRADLRVEPGQLTDATLYHRASQVTFKLVTEAGGEAIADIDWSVKTAGGETVFTDLGAFPATVLAEGDYVVYAKRGETVYNREFEVQPGQSKEIEVLTTVY